MKMQTKRLFGILAVVVGMVFWAGCALEDDETSGGTTGGGGGGGMPTITIQNNTGMTIGNWQIKPSSSTNWSGWRSLWGAGVDGASWTHTFSYMLSANNAYDIQLSSGSSVFARYRVNLSNGTTVRFTMSDFTDESYFPKITILNRTGNTLNNLRIRPSSFTDWGRDFGAIDNNSFRTVTIPIPSSSHTVFDIQMNQTSPATAYTFERVAVTNGMVLMVTRADADIQPLGGMPVIAIQNNTGMTIDNWQIKPSSSTNWSDWRSLWGAGVDGASWTHTLSEPLSRNNRFDVRLRSGNQEFTRTNITVTDGMLIPFTMSHLD